MPKAIGIGVTNHCNLNCAHCYSRVLKRANLTLPQIEEILKKHPDIKEINFGTGESSLNSQFNAILEMLFARGISVGLTSNGLSVCRLDPSILRQIRDVDISLDFPYEEAHDTWRGLKGIYRDAIAAIEKCLTTGVKTSIAVALMSVNADTLKDFRPLLDRFGCALRINIYKPVETDRFSLTYEQFWEAVRTLATNFSLVSCSEPVLSLVIPDMTTEGSPCGSSIRIHPDLQETPCVYLGTVDMTTATFNQLKKRLPEFCKPCAVHAKCGGGCFGRRILEGRAELPDRYCPKPYGYEVPDIQFTRSEQQDDFIHSSYLCTIIVR